MRSQYRGQEVVQKMKKEYIRNLYDLYSDDVYRFAYAYMGSGADAEDIVQEVFLKFIQKK